MIFLSLICTGLETTFGGFLSLAQWLVELLELAFTYFLLNFTMPRRSHVITMSHARNTNWPTWRMSAAETMLTFILTRGQNAPEQSLHRSCQSHVLPRWTVGDCQIPFLSLWNQDWPVREANHETTMSGSRLLGLLTQLNSFSSLFLDLKSIESRQRK